MAAQNNKPSKDSPLVFPYANSKDRLNRYEFNRQLFIGEHFDAFNVKVDSEAYTKQYARLRYVVANFAGLVSKVSADMLFGEAPKITLPTIDKANPYNKNQGDGVNPEANADATDDVYQVKMSKPNPNQEWLENLIFENRLDTQFYESSLTNSYKGDGLFKLRVGPLHDEATSSVIIEQVMPDYYFPDLDNFNVSADPKKIEISFTIEINEKTYLRKEIHTAGQIANEAYLMEGDKIKTKVALSEIGLNDVPDVENTGVDRILVVHIPNWSDGTNHFGYDDYQDLISLFYALNNRLSLIDNILDKHADPILAVPEGVLDEDGNVNRSKIGVYEKAQDGDKPEYIVWDAKLEASFEEIDRLMHFLYMTSETSPSVFGDNSSGKTSHAAQESGRALKYRLMRTVSKIKRKQRYYDYAIKEIILLAQMLAKQYNLSALDVAFQGNAEIPSIEWPDPIPQDSYEQAQEEELRLSSGNQTLKDSIKNIDHLDDEQAVQKIQEIMAEKKQLEPDPIPMPGSNAPGVKPPQTDPFGKPIAVPQDSKPADASA